MDKGDSVLYDTEQQACALRTALYRNKRKATIRKMDHGWRVWRTA